MHKTSALTLGAFALTFLVAAAPAAASGDMVTLRPAARVESAQIRLGDLFDHTGDHADDVVATAPMAGGNTLFEAPWLSATARAHGLDWRPPSTFTAIRVDRASVTVDNAEIAARLAAVVGKGSSNMKVVLDSQVRLYVPTGVAVEIGVENVQLSRQTGHFTAELRVPANDMMAQPMRVSGRLESMIDIPVLARAMAPGEQIKASDIVWTQIQSNSLPTGDLLDPKEIVGHTPRHPLRAEQPLRAIDLQIPVVVKRNELVLIILERPGLYLTAEGKTLEEGGQGSVIRVTNTQSNRTIDATVLGSGRVAARMPSLQQAAVN
jgi:flagella basal body P-ring formation protein FlgA